MAWIPPEVRQALLELNKLEENQFDELVEAVSKRPVTMYPNEKSWWPRHVDGIADDVLAQVLEAALALRWLASEHDHERAADTLFEIISSTAKHGNLAEEDTAKLRRRAERLVSVPSLVMSSRAFVLSMSNPNCLVRSRVFTDVRPVFLNSSSVELSGAVVLHKMHLSFVGPEDDVYVTMDSRDVRKLIEQLQRAQLKGTALAETLSRAAVSTFPASAIGE